MAYKVIIAGAGPGGAVLARELARHNIDVTIYEKGSFDDLGHDWSDAVELVALAKAGFDMPELVNGCWKGKLVKETGDHEGLFEKHAVTHLRVNSPGYADCKVVEFRMITTDRRRLGQQLIKEALDAGAEIIYDHEVNGLLFHENGRKGLGGVDVHGIRFKDLISGEEKEVYADLVVESSGYKSILRTALPEYTGLADPFHDSDYALVHREVRLYGPKEGGFSEVPDQYRYGFCTGYQWSHIHNENQVDVGAGVKNAPGNPDPLDIIEEFILRNRAIKDEKIRGGRSLCIVGRPLTSFVTNGFLVIGDAASTSVPTTGCGVGSAVLNALWAAEVICQAAKEQRNDIGILWGINKKFYCDSNRGKSFAALSALRTMLQTFSHDELDYLFIKNLLDTGTLQNAINGRFEPPGLLKTIKALSGIGRLSLLLKLNKVVNTAVKIYKHYNEYPGYWDNALYEEWKDRAVELHQIAF